MTRILIWAGVRALASRTVSLLIALGFVVGSPQAAAAQEHLQRSHENSKPLYATGQKGAVLLAMDVAQRSTTVIGDTGFPPQSLALAVTPDGMTAYTIANTQDPTQAQLARIDLATGGESLVGSDPLGQDLYIMGMTFSPDGILYAAGDFKPASPTFNSLYTIDLITGLPTRAGSFDVGSTTSEYIMSFSFDSDGNMYGASMMSLYRIDRHSTTRAATKVLDFDGASTMPSKVMGIAFDDDGRLYAADYIDLPQGGSTIYAVDLGTGLLTPLFETGVAFVHNITFATATSEVATRMN